MAFGWEKVSEGPGKGITSGYHSADWAREKPEMAARAAASGFIPGGYLFLAEGDGARQADYFADPPGTWTASASPSTSNPATRPESHPTEAQARAAVGAAAGPLPRPPDRRVHPRLVLGQQPVTFTDYLWESHYVTGTGTAAGAVRQGPRVVVGRARRAARVAAAVHRQSRDRRGVRAV